jgi:hypothetical protein
MDRKQAIIMTIIVVTVCVASVAYYFASLPVPAPFSIQVTPQEILDSYPGQKCVFMVVIKEEENGNGEPLDISASATDASVTVEPQAIAVGQVAEVTVIPAETSENSTVAVTFTGERGRLKETNTTTIEVRKSIAWPNGDEDPLGALATEIQDKFVPWLAANHPEFGITNETEWTGVLIRPHHMVVMFYLFFSEEWEMGVSWHVMIPPHDWARIYLRNRDTETSPSYAFELSSYTMEDYTIREVTLEEAFAESVWR